MNHQEFREAILAKKPKYNEKFRPLMERISRKGDTTGKGDFSTFGAFYQTFMYAYIIGLRLGKKTPLDPDDKKVDFVDLSHWRPTPVRDFILMTLMNRTEEFGNFSWEWIALENCSEKNVENFIVKLIQEMEAYANTGLIYLQDKWENEQMLFHSPFVFVDILQDLNQEEQEEYYVAAEAQECE